MSKVWAWFYHWHTVIQGAFCLSLAFDSTRLPNVLFAGFWAIVWDIWIWVVIFPFIGTLVADTQHNNVTCPRCIMEIPSDAAWQAKRKDKQLRLWHWEVFSWRQSLPLIMIPMIVSLVVVSIWPATLMGYIASVVMVGWWLQRWYSHRSKTTHEQLKSFCPYCKGGNDDDREPEIVPDPEGTKIA